MTKWIQTQLGKIANVTMGQSPKSKYYNSIGEGLPFLQGNRTFGDKYPIFDTYTTNPTKTANAQDIIMSVRAPVGDLNITPTKICLGRGVCSIRMKNNNQEFLYYLMRYYIKDLLNRESGTVFGSVNKNDISGLVVNVPECSEIQNKIASVLFNLDNKIELNNKINNNLEQQAQALFKSWFVDKENSERKTIKAEEFFDISIGKTPPRKEPEWFTNNSDDIVWISISDMGSCGTFISNSSEYLVKEAISKFNIKIVPDNTVLLSFKLTVGRIAITDGEMTTNEAIAHFVTDKTEVNEYLYCYLKNFNFQTMGSTSSIATAVNSKIIKSMPFVLPTEKELTDFHVVTYPMFRQIKENQRENTRLAQLRDALLPKLMSGEIDVSNVDISALTSTDKLSFTEE